MTVKEIVFDYLKKNIYGGLCNYECDCKINDLEACGEMKGDCVAGYLAYCCECALKDDCDTRMAVDLSDLDFLIAPTKCWKGE